MIGINLDECIDGHYQYNGITDNIDEWKQEIIDRFDGEPMKLVFPEELSRCKYFMTSPVALFKRKSMIAVSRASDNLLEITDKFCREDFLMYCIYEFQTEECIMYICRGVEIDTIEE